MPRFSRVQRRTVLVGGALIAVVAVPGLAACADAQPGDVNNGPGYTNNVADLTIKVQNYAADPCRRTQDAQIYANCGRFVTEVASAAGSIAAQLPGNKDVSTLTNAVNGYQRLGCDAITGTPTAAQRTGCPQALTTIGGALDRLTVALEKVPQSTSG
jgi:hypothetical protein